LRSADTLQTHLWGARHMPALACDGQLRQSPLLLLGLRAACLPLLPHFHALLLRRRERPQTPPLFNTRHQNDNVHSRNAVEVVISGGEQIGFVPEEDAQDLAPLLDSGHKYTAHVKRLLTEGRSPIPVVFASVYRADADLSSKKGSATSSQQPVGSVLLRIFVVLVVVGLIIKACS
jgi:hypothetical protein